MDGESIGTSHMTSKQLPEDLFAELNKPNIENYIDSASPPDDLFSVFVSMFKKINIKIAFFLMFVFMLLNTVVFMNTMSKIPNTVELGHATEKGVIVQAILLVLCYIIFDMLSTSQYV